MLCSAPALWSATAASTQRESDRRLQRMIEAAVSSAPDGVSLAEPEVIARGGSFWLLAEIVPMTSFVRDLFNGGDSLLHRPCEGKGAIGTVARSNISTHGGPKRDPASSLSRRWNRSTSARLAIGRETARTQLRAILAKTGTHRQAELTAPYRACACPHDPK